jgi:predicted nucleotidyltransferase
VEEVAASVDRAQSLARRFALELRAHFGHRLRSIRLYGSAARGDWFADSDIDVLVLLDQVGKDDGDWLVGRAFSLGVLENGMVLQPLFMAEDDFLRLLKRERRFALDVQREGIAL